MSKGRESYHREILLCSCHPIPVTGHQILHPWRSGYSRRGPLARTSQSPRSRSRCAPDSHLLARNLQLPSRRTEANSLTHSPSLFLHPREGLSVIWSSDGDWKHRVLCSDDLKIKSEQCIPASRG